MDQNGLAFHETMELHEMVNFKTICLLQSKLMQGVCFDSDLKMMMEKDAQQSIHQMNELLELYKGARAF
ncbi:spore coat protein [Domibacillus sp. A3M-37]|uniref:spore coat protein n=1 Tax=Domibacillus sp. A3M-37 TaxID=2962037 RepID=UPI0020B7D5B4|nr:spore coat protein [Domibacillus sp. A3M-37]MCP3762172.1 spore coat protein [Domibacillus sp. A3M-37]